MCSVFVLGWQGFLTLIWRQRTSAIQRSVFQHFPLKLIFKSIGFIPGMATVLHFFPHIQDDVCNFTVAEPEK